MTTPRIAELLAALAFLEEGAQITITVQVKDLRSALESKAGGPQIVTAKQAAEHVGRTPEFWRRAAEAGKIAGAWQDSEGGPWRLPRDACEAHIRSLQHRRSARHRSDAIPFDAGKARGPRRTQPPEAA